MIGRTLFQAVATRFSKHSALTLDARLIANLDPRKVGVHETGPIKGGSSFLRASVLAAGNDAKSKGWVRVHLGEDTPPGRPWVDPSDHLVGGDGGYWELVDRTPTGELRFAATDMSLFEATLTLAPDGTPKTMQIDRAPPKLEHWVGLHTLSENPALRPRDLDLGIRFGPVPDTMEQSPAHTGGPSKKHLSPAAGTPLSNAGASLGVAWSVVDGE